MIPGLSTGQRGHMTWTVGPEHVIHLGADSAAASGGVVVFSTPNMIMLMERAARAALADYLEDGEESVGVTINIEHLAGTPIGAIVRGEAVVTHIDGRSIDFEITAYDGLELLGKGTHHRAVVKTEKIRQRIADKSQKLPTGVLLPMAVQPNTGSLPALPTLLVERDGALLIVTLNRPDKLNAVDVQMTGDWEQLVAWLAGHPDVRVVIVTGAGRAFCAGDDVKEVGTLPVDAATHLSLRQARMYLSWESLPQMFIAAVNGPALGGGCVAAYSADLRIASQNAEFGMPEILLGWPPGYGVAQLTALVGKARAIELCCTGKTISAQQALEYGLVNAVVPQVRLMAEARKLAGDLLATPPQALRETKKLIHADEGARPKVTFLADTAAYIRCLQTPDAQEGIAAFTEKRKAKFTGA
jgi:enoyl-CoA hydratase